MRRGGVNVGGDEPRGGVWEGGGGGGGGIPIIPSLIISYSLYDSYSMTA